MLHRKYNGASCFIFFLCSYQLFISWFFHNENWIYFFYVMKTGTTISNDVNYIDISYMQGFYLNFQFSPSSHQMGLRTRCKWQNGINAEMFENENPLIHLEFSWWSREKQINKNEPITIRKMYNIYERTGDGWY